MGQIVKQLSEHTTRYYWYPGDKREWGRAAVAAGTGLVAIAVLCGIAALVIMLSR